MVGFFAQRVDTELDVLRWIHSQFLHGQANVIPVASSGEVVDI